jgi:hypothetical protein
MLTMAPVPTEINPGVFWWTVRHPRIKQDVSSYFIAESGTLLDPMIPEEGLDWFGADGGAGVPQRIVLTNRHHLRDSEAFDAAFGCSVHCNDAGLHEFANGPDVEGFFVGDEVAPGVVARKMGAICPDDTALEISAGPGLLAFADALIHTDGEVGFVPDFLMDDPPAVKRVVVAAVRRLCDLDFDGLLFAHGDPMPTGGRAALESFLERHG